MYIHTRVMPLVGAFIFKFLLQIHPPPAFTVANSMQTETEFYFSRGNAAMFYPAESQSTTEEEFSLSCKELSVQ